MADKVVRPTDLRVHEERFGSHIVRVTDVPWQITTPKGATGTDKDIVLTRETYDRCRELVSYVLLYAVGITLAGRVYAYIREALDGGLTEMSTRMAVPVEEIEKVEDGSGDLTSTHRERFLSIMKWFISQDIGTEEPPTFQRTELGTYTVWTIAYQPPPAS